MKTASRKSAAPKILRIESESGNYADPDEVIRPLGPALEAMRHSYQRMTVELKLPAHLWIMLKDIASHEKFPDQATISSVVSEMLFTSAELRKRWYECNTWEGEVLESVLREIAESSGKLDVGLTRLRERLRPVFESKA